MSCSLQCRNHIEHSDIVVFQNSLNDASETSSVKKHIESVWNALKPGALLVVIDFSGFSHVRTAMYELFRLLKGKTYVTPYEQAKFYVREPVVHPFFSQVFDGSASLMVKRNVNYIAMAIQKSHGITG